MAEAVVSDYAVRIVVPASAYGIVLPQITRKSARFSNVRQFSECGCSYLTLVEPALPCYLASLPQVQLWMLSPLHPHPPSFLNDPTMKANSTAGPQWLKRWIEIVKLQLKARGVIRPGGSAVIQ